MQTILLAAVLAAAGPTELRIENAAARVVVIPRRGGVLTAAIRQAKDGPPLQLRREGAALVVDGGQAGAGRGGIFDLFNQSRCRTDPATLPLVTVRAPADARIVSSGAIFGQVGPADSLTLTAKGCGRWAAGSVAGPLSIHVDGHTRVTVAGNAPRAELVATGASRIEHTGEVGSLTAEVHGSSTVQVRLVNGQVDSLIDGTGDVTYGRPAKGSFCTQC
jgi:hypothetical protein